MDHHAESVTEPPYNRLGKRVIGSKKSRGNTSNHDEIITVGVAGGSGAGKTTVAEIIRDQLGPDLIAYVPLDAYYRDLSHLPEDERDLVNFDHPDSFDTDLLIEHIHRLQNGQAIDAPTYDFTSHTRTNRVKRILPRRIILIEGILIFAEARMRALFDLRVFIDTDPDIRFARRLQRDVNERGRTVESVVKQWLQTVRPMYLEFVEPSKRYAHIIIPGDEWNEAAIDVIVARLKGSIMV